MCEPSDERRPLLPVKFERQKPPNKRLPGELLSKKARTRLINEYYEDQKHLQKTFEDDKQNLDEQNRLQHIEESKAAHEARTMWDKRLATFIFVQNIGMLIGTLIASVLSSSYAVISAFIDSAMDITSSVVIFIALWSINNTNMFNYPRGRQRLELLAVIISSVIMGVANIMMIIQSVGSIINDTVNPDANIPTITILWIGILVKTIVMIICYKHGTPSSKTLAMDQRNDIITSVVAFLGAFVGDHYWKYADPVGAILVCSFIALSWFGNAFEHIPMIAGRRAEREHLHRILNIALHHDDRIKCFDHIMVYHIGEKELVELHIVLDETLPLKVTHDIAESLEVKIRALEFVDRVFVHVDYYCDGFEDGC